MEKSNALDQSKCPDVIRKADGDYILRSDIQYDLLEYILKDKHEVFTPLSSGSGAKVTFAKLYWESILASKRIGKTLKERLLQDDKATNGILKVSLLLNVGRFNTTLVFTPAQTRTFNSIPSIQCSSFDPDDTDKKNFLPDISKLKPVLRGCSENSSNVESISSYLNMKKNHEPLESFNPVNILFLISNDIDVINENFFPNTISFIDLFTKEIYSSESRANAFLFLMYILLETDLSTDEIEKCPFRKTEYPVQSIIPTLKSLSDDEVLHENKDTENELKYGEMMKSERMTFLQSNQMLQDADASKTLAEDKEKCHDIQTHVRQSNRKRKKTSYQMDDESEDIDPHGKTKANSRKVRAKIEDLKTERIETIIQNHFNDDIEQLCWKRKQNSALQRMAVLLGLSHTKLQNDIMNTRYDEPLGETGGNQSTAIEEALSIRKCLNKAQSIAYGGKCSMTEVNAVNDYRFGDEKAKSNDRRQGRSDPKNNTDMIPSTRNKGDSSPIEDSSENIGQGKTLPGLSALGYAF